MKRFYKDVSVCEQEDYFVVLLDGKTIKTPEKRLCVMPTEAMAHKIAEEWRVQDEDIIPASMPITKLLNTALDRVGGRRSEIIDELIEYAGADQLCYRADHPPELMEQQNYCWDPLQKKIKDAYGIALETTCGVVYIQQPKEQMGKIRNYLAVIEDFPLMAFYIMTTITGSVTIGINLFEGYITADEAWNAGQLDENFQISKWGTDSEAEKRRDNLKLELDNANLFLSLC